MASHLGLLVVFAGSVSAVFAVLTTDEPSEQIRTGARMFGGFLLAGLGFSWVLRAFPL
jgi:hypothetical protein